MEHPAPSAPDAASGDPPAASDSDVALRHLSQILAHRLRGLVTSIEGFADLLTDTLAAPEQRDMLLRIFEGTTRIERVLADLQRYSEPEQPLMRQLRVPDIIGGLEAALEEEEFARVALSWDAEDVAIQADPLHLRQALLELIHNALDASALDDEIVSVRIHAGTPEVLTVEVRNAGRIALEAAEQQVFTPFFTTKAHNLGVGLSIARRIAERHGGRLRLASNGDQQGVCFALTLPLAPGPDDADAAARHAPEEAES